MQRKCYKKYMYLEKGTCKKHLFLVPTVFKNPLEKN